MSLSIAKRLSRNLTFWVILMGLLGYLCAVLFADKSWVGNPSPPIFYELVLAAKRWFLQLLRMLVAPLVFFSIIAGLVGIGSVVRLRSLGKATLGYYVLTTFIAASLGLLAVYFIHPWENAGMAGAAETMLGGVVVDSALSSSRFIAPESTSYVAVLDALLSKAFVNPFTALADTNILGIVFNAFVIGIAMILVLSQDSPLIKAVEHTNRVIGKVLGWLILIAPVGVFAIIFDFSLQVGGAIIEQLASFVLLVIGVTLVHGLLILPFIAFLFAGVNPMQLFRRIGAPLAVAFSTSSSSATLPVSLKTCRDELAVPDEVSSFVLPLGATMNMDGTALFEGIAAIFLAYVFGIELTAAAIFAIFIMTMVSSIGAPGMPSGSMAGMQMVLIAAGIPLEAIALLLVVERPLDTIRTAVNVEGDIVGALVVTELSETQDQPLAEATHS